MSDEDASKFMAAVADMIFLADGAAETKVFEPDEAQRLREDVVRFRQSAASVFFGIEALLTSLYSNQDCMSFSEFDMALEQLIISSYRIGAATWTHKANVRFVDTNLGPKRMRGSKPDALSDQDREHRRQALEAAWTKPLSKPLGKARGRSAYAVRLLPAFNAHLKSLGAEPVSQDVVEKLLRENPPPNSGQK